METRRANFFGFISSFCGVLLLASSLTVSAATDNERWNQGQAELQKQLAPGMAAADYRKKIEELGYQITSTNYNNPDYLEYELVKGDQTWEVQIDVDSNNKKATKVDVVSNTWKTDATERALGRNVALNSKPMYRNPYSERDRISVARLIKELEAMPVGQGKQFYKDELKKHGYEVTRVNTDDADKLSLEAVKGANSVELNVAFNEKTGKSTSIDADSIWFESQSTSDERHHQEAHK
jgi:uncharacterized protein YmfQ (DUF2313 family)